MITGTFKEAGQLFRDKRRELNLSLKEVESSTSIRMPYLQAIEEGEVSRLISPVYARGFVTQYASFLGLDAERLIAENSEVFNQRVLEGKDFQYGIGTLEMRTPPGGGVKAVPNALLWGGMVLLFLAAGLLARYLDLI